MYTLRKLPILYSSSVEKLQKIDKNHTFFSFCFVKINTNLTTKNWDRFLIVFFFGFLFIEPTWSKQASCYRYIPLIVFMPFSEIFLHFTSLTLTKNPHTFCCQNAQVAKLRKKCNLHLRFCIAHCGNWTVHAIIKRAVVRKKILFFAGDKETRFFVGVFLQSRKFDIQIVFLDKKCVTWKAKICILLYSI